MSKKQKSQELEDQWAETEKYLVDFIEVNEQTSCHRHSLPPIYRNRGNNTKIRKNYFLSSNFEEFNTKASKFEKKNRDTEEDIQKIIHHTDRTYRNLKASNLTLLSTMRQLRK